MILNRPSGRREQQEQQKASEDFYRATWSCCHIQNCSQCSHQPLLVQNPFLRSFYQPVRHYYFVLAATTPDAQLPLLKAWACRLTWPPRRFPPDTHRHHPSFHPSCVACDSGGEGLGYENIAKCICRTGTV